MNPFLKLIKQDLFDYAIKNNGVIHKEVIESLLVNLNYKEIFNLYYQKEDFIFQNIINKCFFITLLDKNKSKKLGFPAKDKKEADFFYEEAWNYCQKEKILEAFYENGLDPYLFIKTAMLNIKRVKNGYVFKDFEEIVKKYVEELDIEGIREKLKERVVNDIEESESVIEDLPLNKKENKNCDEINSNSDRAPLSDNALLDDDVNFIELINYDSSLLLDKSKLQKALNWEESKNTWHDLQQMLMKEGVDLKKANAQIAKLLKEESMLDVFDALRKIKERKTTPTSIIGAIKYIIGEKKQDKFNQFSITSYVID